MRVRKLLWGRMVMTEFADCGQLGAETGSAKKRLPERPVSGVECGGSGADATPSPSRRGLKRAAGARVLVNEIRCNTVPIEKGTETIWDGENRPENPAEMQHRPHREGD